METETLNVEGMKCDGCASTLRKAIEKVAGVNTVVTSHTEKSATVSFDPKSTDIDGVKAVIEEAGYRVTA